MNRAGLILVVVWFIQRVDAEVSFVAVGGQLREVGGHLAGADVGEPVEGVAVAFLPVFGDGLGGFLRPKVIEGDVDGYHEDVVVTVIACGGEDGVAVVASADVLAYLGGSKTFGFKDGGTLVGIVEKAQYFLACLYFVICFLYKICHNQ